MTASALDVNGGRAAGGLRRSPGVVREVGLIVAATLLYALVRGLTSDRISVAFDNAEQVVSFERSIGLFVEPHLQRGALDHDFVVTAANAVYIAFWPIVALTLAWMVVRHPVEYPRFRNAVLASGALSLVIFAVYPLAPPRFVPHHGFIDTITQNATTYRNLNAPALVNEYAAMPSLHFGWMLLVGFALATVATHRVVRMFGVVLPLLMFASIVLTANHYIVDGIAGGIVIALGMTIAAAIDRRTASRRVPTTRPVPEVEQGGPVAVSARR